MTIIPKTIYRFNAIIKLLMAFFTELDQKIYHLYRKRKITQVTKTILKKRGTELDKWSCWLKLQYKAAVIKILCGISTQQRHIDNKNWIKTQKQTTHVWSINPHDKGKNIYWRKTVSSISCAGNLPATCKNMKLQCSLTLYTEINITWIKDITFYG